MKSGSLEERIISDVAVSPVRAWRRKKPTGLVSTNAWLEGQGVGFLGDGAGLAGFVVPLAVAWTLVIAGYLVWSFLRRPDEERFLAVLRDAYRLPEPLVEAAEPEPPAASVETAAADPTPPPEDR